MERSGSYTPPPTQEKSNDTVSEVLEAELAIVGGLDAAGAAGSMYRKDATTPPHQLQ